MYIYAALQDIEDAYFVATDLWWGPDRQCRWRRSGQIWCPYIDSVWIVRMIQSHYQLIVLI